MPDFPKEYNFKQVEEEISRFWEKEKTAEKTIRIDEKKPLFSFLEGPPTANAPPGLHHVQSRFFKDLVCRFHYMKGYSVPRKGGWDCHGLPVEVQVEKKLGLKTKKEVISYGIGKFNELCRKDIFTFINDWNTLTKRMAFWIDIEKPYVTLTNEYIESVWWSLKELYKKGLLYEEHKVVPYCPRCETPLSSHEVALGYADVTEETVTTKFRLREKEQYLLGWTTTPWTTPSNIALAVGKDIIYAVVEEKGTQYILAKEAIPRYFSNPVIIREMSGEELVGKEYVPLFDYFIGKLDKPAWKIIATDFVSAQEGTGIVHQAPAFGEEDYNAVKKAGMAFVQPVDESGKFTKEASDFEGMFVKDADAAIIEQLEKDNLLFRKEKYTHSYPFCWRCATPLLYYALKSWFVKVTAFKEQLIENNEKIDWYPEHIKHGRFGDWLNNLKDWALSRNRFWGTPLPIWICEKCRQQTAIGSIKELEMEGANTKNLDLHKPAVDEIKLECDCGGTMSRVPYVIDTWYDSGAATFAQLHYPFENRELFGKLFPYSFITEGIDQTRGWFYTLHALGTLLFGTEAYKSVVVSGLVVDETGKKMSKSKGNVFNPFEIFDKVGVDAVRLQFSSSAPDSEKRFGYELIRENVTPFITTLWNTCYFASEALKAEAKEISELRKEDKWIISRVNTLIKEATHEFNANNYHRCFEGLKKFAIEDLSRWYIRLVRERNDDAVADTLRQVISTTAKLLAPFAPYLSEYIYLNLTPEKEKSIHLTSWPQAEKSDTKLEEQMSLAREITQAILSAREKIQRSLRWPVKEAIIVSKDAKVQEAINELGHIIKAQANVKSLKYQTEFKEAKERLKPDYSKLGPLYGEATPAIIAQLAMQSAQAITRKLDEIGTVEVEANGSKYTLEKQHFITTTELPQNYDAASFPLGAAYIDKEITAEMEAEGFARETARLIQQSRKESGLRKSQLIGMAIKTDKETAAMLSTLGHQIREKVGAKELEITDTIPKNTSYTQAAVHTIKGRKVEIYFEKI